MFGKMRTWVRQNQREAAIIGLILTIALGMRVWRINEYMTFLGDEGRDARVVARFVTEGDLMFIGPMTSFLTSEGHMYLGPAYYYLMAPALALSGLHPVGPAVMVALLSVLTCGLLWWIGRKWFAPVAGLVAAWIFAISPTIIVYSRSSWNPNVMPLLALNAIWFSYLARKNSKWWIGVAAALALVFQSHYLGLLLFPVVGLIWVESVWRSWKVGGESRDLRSLGKYSAWAVGVFALSLVPQLLFEYKHGWMNARALEAFFTERQTSVNLKFYKRIGELWPLVESMFKSTVGGISVGREESSLVVKITIWALGITTLVAAWKRKITLPYLIMLLWFGVGVVGLLSYKQNIFDHYLGFFYPLLPLMVGWMVWQLVDEKGILGSCKNCLGMRRVWVGFLIAGLTLQLLANSPLQYGPNRQWQKTQAVADLIIEKSQGEPFNLGLIADGNYDEGYRYALERKKSNLVELDQQRSETITQQLFVICEQECNPIGHAQTEIAHFGWAEIEDVWQEETTGYRIYKLGHFSAEE